MGNPLPPPVSDLEVRLGVEVGSLDEVDRLRLAAAIEEATVLALAEVSAAKATAWKLDAPDVVLVVIRKAARREFENPRGLASESLGEHAVGATDTSGVFLTAREIAQIRRAATGAAPGFRLGTIRTPAAFENV